MGSYTVAIATVLAIIVVGAVTGYSIDRATRAHAATTKAEQVAPFDLMARSRNLPVQAAVEAF